MMRLIFSSMVLITSTLVLMNDAAQPETDVQMLVTSVSKIMAEMSDIKTELRSLSEKKDNTEKQLTQLQELDHGNEYSNFKMDSQLNDTNLEERVQALEFQMENVHDDITSLNTGLSDLNEDVEGQFVLVEEQITLILDEIFQLIDETDTLDSSIEVIEDTIDGLTATDSEIMDFIDELDSRVTTLELLNGTDEDVINILNEHEAGINSLNITAEGLRVDVTNVEETIVTLQQSDQKQEVELSTLDERVTVLESLNGTNGDVEDALNDLDERVFELELDGTFAFHAVLASYSSIPEDTPAIFDEVNVNLGNGYSPTTGLFTVPSGGAGLYYFYTHLLYYPNENSNFPIRHNGFDLCDTYADGGSGDWDMTSCGAVVVLEEGDVVGVYNEFSSDDTPIEAQEPRCSFSGFRIAPR